MTELCWTGFEAFGGLQHNPSGPAARAAADVTGGDSFVLPVTYRAVRTFCDTPPVPTDWPWIHLGVGRSRDDVCVEVTAHNRTGDQADNDGEIPPGMLDEAPRAPNALSTAIDPNAVVRRIQRHIPAALDLSVRASRDAGSFVCNALYYFSLCRSGGGGHRLFIHIPHVDDSTADRLGRSIARGLESMTRR